MHNQEILRKLGLERKESAIYLALLELGPSTISDISKKTGIHRPLIYAVLPKIIERGLVVHMPKGKRKYYVAEPPEKLEVLFEELRLRYSELIPQLKSMYQTANTKPIVKFLEGKRGITSIFEDLVMTLKKGDIFYRYSSAKDSVKANSYLPINYREVRDRKQLERFVITSELHSKDKKPRMERAMKVVPKEYGLFNYDVTQIIYANKIAFIDYNTETAFVIENPLVAEFQKTLFKIIYNRI